MSILKNFTRKKFACSLLISSLIVSLCVPIGCTLKKKTSSPTTHSNSSQPVVYTSIYPLYDFTKKIGGNKVTVINIAPAGSEPHSYEPSSKLVADLSKATLFLYHGAGMEPYLNKLLNTLQGTPLLMIEASRGISLITHQEEKHKEKHEEEQQKYDENTASPEADEHHHGQTDPHTWLSPICAQQLCQNILQALIQVDPANQSYYTENYHAVEKRLTKLDQEYRQSFSNCKNKELVVTHEAFGYLCREYGLTQIAVMGLSAETEPTPGTLREVIDFVRARKINYIFFEALYSPKVADTISRETKAKILVLNPLGSLSEKAMQNGEDYFSIMKQNLANLQKALESEL